MKKWFYQWSRKIRKVSDEECKSPLALLEAHESQISYVVFVAQQILGIIGSQLKLKGYSTLPIYAQTCDRLDWAYKIWKCL